MIIIDDILVSEDVVKKHFICNLDACKGACCYEGDYGAPLEKDELSAIREILEEVKPYLSEASISKIEKDDFYTFNKSEKLYETALMPDEACVFMGRESSGITYCGIEKAYLDGKTSFKKPISCHLYPIRVSKNDEVGFEALNYDKWDICSAACKLGAENKVRIFEFVKDGLIRKYGEAFYEELSEAVKYMERD